MSKIIDDFFNDYEYPVHNAWILLISFMLDSPMECVVLDYKVYRYNPESDSFESADPLHNRNVFSKNYRLNSLAEKFELRY